MDVWTRRCAVFLTLTTLARLALIGLFDLKVEEAYYWDYGQHPDLSYFDHPLMVGLLIRAGTAVGGNHPFWVRLPAVLLFTGSCALFGAALRAMLSSRVAFTGVVLMSALPCFAVHSMFILPDAPLLFFWCLGLWAGWKLAQSRNPRWWWLVGLATGLGMDSKYPAVLIPLGVFIFLIWSRRWSEVWCRPMWGAALLANLLFTPVLVWNATHGWASIRFQGSERFTQSVTWGDSLTGWLLQLAMLSPFGLPAVAWALLQAWRRRHEEPMAYLLAWSLPFLSLMVYVSLCREVQMNWPMPGYVGATGLLAAALVSLWDERRLQAALVGTLVALPALLLSLLPWIAVLTPIPLANPGDDVSDWKVLGSRLLEARAHMPHPERTFLMGQGYQVASEIAFTTGLAHLTLANNVVGTRALSFEFWEKPGAFVGWDALVVVYLQPHSNGEFRERVHLDEAVLASCFERIDPPQVLTLFRGGARLRQFRIYQAYGYRGPPAGQ